MRSIYENDDGADREALVLYASLVVNGQTIEPDFQKLINVLITQAVLSNKLPPKKLGRPKDESKHSPFIVAYRYFEMLDAGVSYANAVDQLSKEFHKDERHLMRLVSAGKKELGETLERRQLMREWWTACAVAHEAKESRGEKSGLSSDLEALEAESKRMDEDHAKRDLFAETDEMIEKLLTARFATDTK